MYTFIIVYILYHLLLSIYCDKRDVTHQNTGTNIFLLKTNDQLICHTGTCSKFLVYFVLNRRNKLYFQLSRLLLCNYNVFISVQPGSKA